ncbi:TonB-dependent Receptor Plug Domain [Bryocella elongata]|uniref:TonB-dependent Receptor Plug Domain n=1 Tax=Bryocella elongata TaxID=863522 RepID=A0A1H5VYH6_9BACT|nr:TonB-dependent receptor [Bryocella elongata]SEF92078.1 TonB-dependent Receptor Plug Domain [Bryocella elongata]
MQQNLHNGTRRSPQRLVAFLLTFAACFAILAFTPLARAQYDNGSLLGTIKDPSGAPIANASVTVTDAATGISTQTKTNGSGDYEVPTLHVGTYRISATAQGFSEAVAQNIAVSVGGRQRIDLTLKVGGDTTTVEVSDVALQLETETSERGQVITGYQSEAFPLVSRNYSDLLALIPGSRQAPTAATTSSINSLVRAGAYNINGQRSMFNNFILDGIDNNAYGESNQGFDNQIIAVPPDSVAQFQVVTNNESAEYGRSSGATINVASQSGTNKFHGTVYEFIRNTDLNAAGFFKPTQVGGTGITTAFKKPTFNRNQFGFNLGGPIIPNKLFFFVDYEGFRQVLKPLSVLTLPTQDELKGILAVPVKNATTGVAYAAGTAIPTSAINPLSAQILGYYSSIVNALPTVGLITEGTSGPTGLASNDYAVQVPFTDNADKGDLRLDYQVNPKLSTFLRISDRKENGVNYPAIPLPLDGQTNGKIRILDQQIALGAIKQIGDNKVLDARIGLNRTKAGKYTLSIGDNVFSIPGLPSNPVVAGGLPSVGITGFTAFGRQSTNPQWQNPAFLDPKVNFSWVKGKHSMKFGYEFEHLWMAVNDNNPLYGSYTYGGGYSVCTATYSPTTCGNDINGVANKGVTVSDDYWADFLFGTTSSYSLANYYVAHLTQTIQSVYAQDDWKALPNLTINLGLRWEYGSPYGDLHNAVSNFDPVSQTVLTTTPGAVSGSGITPISAGGVYGRTLVNPDLNDFAPRIGFSYAVDPKTDIRGGFGISYVHYTRAGSGDILNINAPQAQFAAVTQIAPTTSNKCSTPLPAQIIAVGTTTPSCYATADQGYPSGLVTSFNSATDNITWVPKNTRDSYVESYFLSVQRTLIKNSVLDIAYVGNHGLKLQGFLNGNQKNPSNGFARPFGNWPSDITEALNEFYSNYNSLQVKYEQRFAGGLTLLNSFNWQHSLDNASASLEGNTPSPQDGNNIRADYSQSDYNLPVSNITSLVYELPFGRGKTFATNTSGAMDALIGGWQLSLINTAQGGTPFNLTFTPNSAQQVSQQISATYRGANEYRPDRVAGVAVTQGRSSISSGTGYVNYVNYNAFRLQPIKDVNGAVLSPFGTASRNPGRTPALYQSDFAVNKKFVTPVPGLKVEFRTEFYNLFNHTNLYLPSTIGGTQGTTSAAVGTGGSVPVGAITGGVPTSGGQITSTFTPRVIQFGLKILY